MKWITVLTTASVLLALVPKAAYADTIVTGNSSVTVNSSTSVSTNTGGGGTTQSHQNISVNANGQEVNLQSNEPNGSSSVEVHSEGNNPPTTTIKSTDPNAQVNTNITPKPSVEVVKKSEDTESSPSGEDTSESDASNSEISSITAQINDLAKNSQVNDFADKMGNLIAQLTDALMEKSRELWAQISTKFSL